ncbi:hypothetical protein [Ensifer sp. SSB1]|uniref:hypothetical protein n=1 Tax=Ensifer sp. SSB1 TaxID=2795385 RepID=UPI001A56F50D|nr:hypothetical protein [Ensifer sp. SSB1]MBK5571305.1 hypothetical protein [Ensifer sp. SSB1]
MGQTTETMGLWNSVFETDPAHTKDFSRSGGFKGTAINPLYLIKKATELWGPMGTTWGPEIVSEQILIGAPIVVNNNVVGHESVHCVQIKLRHPGGTVPAFGQTTFVGRNSKGTFTDEEAPKKSLTDAIGKALSWLGFSADVHMGMYDDSKYVNDMRAKFGHSDAGDQGGQSGGADGMLSGQALGKHINETGKKAEKCKTHAELEQLWAEASAGVSESDQKKLALPFKKRRAQLNQQQQQA